MPKQSSEARTPQNGQNVTKEAVQNAQKTEGKSRSKTAPKRGAENQYPVKILPYLKDIERYAACGVLEGQLAEYYRVGKTSWAKYKKEYPEFAETLNRAALKSGTELINRSFEVAMGYDYTETVTVTTRDKTGKETGTKTTVRQCHAKADAGMLQFLLINRIPEAFARDPQTVALRRRALELAEEGKLPCDVEVI